MADSFPARIHAIMARESDRAIVFRRGPSKTVCTFLWDTAKDEFRLGQWLKGRIYERRSDISPRGDYLIYFAMNGKWDSDTRGSWTAISRAPWLKALSLFPKGDCWNGGGLFTDTRSYWLNSTGDETLRVSSEVSEDATFRPDTNYGNEDTGVYYVRLQRDGWRLVGHEERGKWESATIFERPLPKSWVLRKIAHEQIDSPPGRGCYWDEHELENRESGQRITCEEWEWADLNGLSITYAQSGRLYRIRVQSNARLAEPKLLFDFNDCRFEERIAPY